MLGIIANLALEVTDVGQVNPVFMGIRHSCMHTSLVEYRCSVHPTKQHLNIPVHNSRDGLP